MRVLARHPGAGREVRMMLFFGFDAHWTNRSREKPHSRSGTLASTAWEGERRGEREGGGEKGGERRGGEGKGGEGKGEEGSGGEGRERECAQ